LARLDRIEERATHRKLPLAFSNELYTLREHIALVRSRLRTLAETATAPECRIANRPASPRRSGPTPLTP
jgi:hypothetical protein